jgi:glutathione S-transferase
MLEDPSNGLHLVQSHAILRYLAAKHGWYEEIDAKTLALADAAAEGTEDARFEYNFV